MANQSRWKQLKHFFTEEYHALVGFVRSLIDDAADRDAEDIVQDVAFHLFEGGNVAAPVENLASYVYQSLRNRVVDAFRKRKPDRSLDEMVDEESSLSLAEVLSELTRDAGFESEQKDLFNHAMNLIGELSEQDRMLLMATEIDGFSFAELSERWNVPVGTLLSRKSRSLHKIRTTLQTLK